jgi:hypothetical protein
MMQGGPAQVNASMTGGIAPLQARFEVSRSDQPGAVTVYDWGSPSRAIYVGAGDYTLSIKVIPREQTYLRVGYHTIQEIPVCTTGAALIAPDQDPTTTSATGCGGQSE